MAGSCLEREKKGEKVIRGTKRTQNFLSYTLRKRISSLPRGTRRRAGWVDFISRLTYSTQWSRLTPPPTQPPSRRPRSRTTTTGWTGQRWPIAQRGSTPGGPADWETSHIQLGQNFRCWATFTDYFVRPPVHLSVHYVYQSSAERLSFHGALNWE